MLEPSWEQEMSHRGTCASGQDTSKVRALAFIDRNALVNNCLLSEPIGESSKRLGKPNSGRALSTRSQDVCSSVMGFLWLL